MRRLSKQRSCFYQDTDSVPTQTSLSDVESDIDEDEQRPQRQRSNSETDLADIATDLFLAQSCVYLLRHPSVINFYRLRKKLRSDDKRWMDDFLKRNGLELLFECLDNLGNYSGQFSTLVLRLECVMCIKTVMNSAIGLQCLSRCVYAPKFASGILIFSCILCCQFLFSICPLQNMILVSNIVSQEFIFFCFYVFRHKCIESLYFAFILSNFRGFLWFQSNHEFTSQRKA
jgi:hypothetical protein